MKRIVLAAALCLSACGAPPASESSNAEANQELALICEAFEHVTLDALASAYGPENLREETLPGPEGMSYTATVLYPDDSARRLELIWRDDEGTVLESVTVSGAGSLWRGPHDITIGEGLAEVEASNGAPFRLWGFGWDYGGWVSDWNGGAFAPSQGCVKRVRFEPGNEAAGAQGDSEFASDNEAMRNASPRVAEFGLVFGD